MKKFYETYVDDEFVTTLLSQISWSNHLAVFSNSPTQSVGYYLVSELKKVKASKGIAFS
jgi:hypothetical protein